MNKDDLIKLLSTSLDPTLANDLVIYFIELKNELKIGNIGKTSSGKFVETVVQVLQYLENGSYDSKPSVDSYLSQIESRKVVIDDHLKICCSRIARASYSLRNKRNIAHKTDITASIYDLMFLYSSAQWILSEIVRQVIKSDIDTANKAIEYIQIPIHSIIEDFGDRKLIYGDLNIDEELLILMHTCYPEYLNIDYIRKSLDRRARSSVYSCLKKLWDNKYIIKINGEYKLTQFGYQETNKILLNISTR